MKVITSNGMKVFWNRIKSPVGVILGLLICVWPVFLWYFPQVRNSWDLFFTHNANILDIYWQTLLILLTILIPVMLEIIRAMEKRFPKFGERIFFLEIIRVKRFYLLIPFSFLLFFAIAPSEEFKSETLSFVHYILFVVWCFLFWELFQLLEKSIIFFVDSGDAVNTAFSNHLRRTDNDDIEVDKWNSLWETIDSLKFEWQKRLLLIFWQKQNSFIENKKYEVARELFENFSKSFLSLNDNKKRESLQWINARKRWLWFHDEEFNTKEKNPYAVTLKFLKYQYEVKGLLEGSRKSSNSMERVSLYSLHSLITDILEKIFTDELRKTDDFYYGLFRCLRKFYSEHADAGDAYMSQIPIYRPVFDNANHFDLYDYDVKSSDSGFPNEWRILVRYLPVLFEKSLDGFQRLLWINNFSTWARERIDHGKQEYDNTLDAALRMLFPEAYHPWMALAFGYHTLPFGRSRLKSFFTWKRNFGIAISMVDSFQFDSEKTRANQNLEIEVLLKDDRSRQEDAAAEIILRLGFFGGTEEISMLVSEAKELEKLDIGESAFDSETVQESLRMLNAIHVKSIQ